MNKTRRTILSLLLAIALLLPMVPAARAVDATVVALSPHSGINAYYRTSNQQPVTVTAVAAPADYDGTITWTLSGAALTADKALGTALPYNDANRVIKLSAAAVIEETVVTLTATLAGENGAAVSDVVEIRVRPDTAKPFSVTPATASIAAGSTQQLSALSYYTSDSAAAPVTFSSSNTAVATVSATGLVTGVAKGTATITATSVDKTATAVITVTDPTADLTAAATLGTNYPMLDIYDKILLRFNTAFPGQTPNKIVFSGLTSGYGELKDASGAVTNGLYQFIDLRSMYVEPKAEGSFAFSYTVTNDVKTMTGTVTVTITTPTTHIRVPVSSLGDYSFDRASTDASGKTGALLISDAIGTFGSIKFGAIQAGSNVGTLYTSSAATATDRVVNGTYVPATAIGQLYFVPARGGTYSIAYAAYSGTNGTGTLLCSGNLLIPVDGSSLDVTVNLDTVTPYVFSAAPRSGAESAATLLARAINDAVGRYAWSGVKFNAPAATSTPVGTLYQSSAYSRALGSDAFISQIELSSLYFVPARTGTYAITYGVYTSSASAAPVATGTLTINVSNVPSGESDVTYTTSVGSTVSIDENDFINFFQRKYGTRYYLSSVVLDTYEGSDTFFYDSATRFIPYNSADLYTSTYTGTLPTNARFLNRLSFTAPATAGSTAVKFTCYGGLSANATTTTVSGVMRVFYTSGEVPAVAYDAYNAASVDLKEADFVSVYNTATKTSTKAPAFTIRLVSLPANGTLYRYYSTSGRTALTASNLSSYTFTVNGTAAESISKLTYYPNRGANGTDTATYLAYGASGMLLYAGTIQFKLNADRSKIINSDGMGFSATDFYSATDKDPVIYVTFPKPDSGKMYALSGKRYVAVDDSTKFYTNSSADGTYALSTALYAPKVGQTATVSLSCIAHRKSGLTYTDVTTVSVISKTASSKFTDVGSANNTSWAADSIDFASSFGLVGGTGNGRFSPKDTMQRCDLVLILYRMAGSPAVTGSMPYTDVAMPTDSYRTEIYNSALWAYQNGIVRGVVSGSQYSPYSKLLRQDFAQILYNYTAAMGVSTLNNGSIRAYSDAAQVSSYALDGVTWAVANGLITSTSTNGLTISPARTAMRAEIVTFLHRYLTY